MHRLLDYSARMHVNITDRSRMDSSIEFRGPDEKIVLYFTYIIDPTAEV